MVVCSWLFFVSTWEDGSALVWRHRGDGYFIERPEPFQTALHGTFRFQVEPNWAHLDLFSRANYLIINNSRCQVNFTKARFDSISPETPSSVLLCSIFHTVSEECQLDSNRRKLLADTSSSASVWDPLRQRG